MNQFLGELIMRSSIQLSCAFILTFVSLVPATAATDQSERAITKPDVLYALRVRFHHAAILGVFRGANRQQSEPYLIEFLNEFALSGGAGGATTDLSPRVFRNLLAWLSSPPNAEALIGVNEVLRHSRDEGQRKECLSFLDKLHRISELPMPLDGGVQRLAEYYKVAPHATEMSAILMAKALAQHGNSSGKSLLVSVLQDHGADAYTRLESARALLLLEPRNTTALAFISDHLADDEVIPFERTRTMEVLYSIDDARGKAWVGDLMESSDPNRVIHAANLLAIKGDPNGIVKAKSLLASPDPRIRSRAERIIMQHGEVAISPTASTNQFRRTSAATGSSTRQ